MKLYYFFCNPIQVPGWSGELRGVHIETGIMNTEWELYDLERLLLNQVSDAYLRFPKQGIESWQPICEENILDMDDHGSQMSLIEADRELGSMSVGVNHIYGLHYCRFRGLNIRSLCM